MNAKGYDECVDSVPKYILNPVFCPSYFPQPVDLLSWVGEKGWICTECTRILYWGRIWHKCLCTLTLWGMYHSDTHMSMPKRYRGSSLFLGSLCKLFIVQRIATLCFSSQMMPTYQARTLTCCVSITVPIGTVWFLYHLFLIQGPQCNHIHLPAWLSKSGLCGYGLECVWEVWVYWFAGCVICADRWVKYSTSWCTTQVPSTIPFLSIIKTSQWINQIEMAVTWIENTLRERNPSFMYIQHLWAARQAKFKI